MEVLVAGLEGLVVVADEVVAIVALGALDFVEGVVVELELVPEAGLPPDPWAARKSFTSWIS